MSRREGDHSSGSDFNDQLQNDDMLMVEDIPRGKKPKTEITKDDIRVDVRVMLDIKDEDVKTDELRSTLAACSIA